MSSVVRGVGSVALCGLVLGVAAVAAAAPGDFDLTFGVGGTVVTDLGGDDSARAVAVQPDGKIVVAGGAGLFSGAFSGFALARYHSDGSLDASFGSGGLVVTGFGAGHPASAVALALQPDGRIVVAGGVSFGAPNRVALARYTASGALDPTFGDGGTVISDFGGSRLTRAMALQPDGKILVTAWTMPPAPQVFLVARYTADGDLDPAFGAGGTVVTDFGGGVTDFDDVADPLALGVMPDGRFVVAGGGHRDLALARYLPDGQPDPSFGGSGTVTTDLGGIEAILTLALQPDGKIVVSGNVALLADRAANLLPLREVMYGLARYTPSGDLDASFGTGGGLRLDFFPWNVALQPDGKIVAVGHRLTDVVVSRVIGDLPEVSSPPTGPRFGRSP